MVGPSLLYHLQFCFVLNVETFFNLIESPKGKDKCSRTSVWFESQGHWHETLSFAQAAENNSVRCHSSLPTVS